MSDVPGARVRDDRGPPKWADNVTLALDFKRNVSADWRSDPGRRSRSLELVVLQQSVVDERVVVALAADRVVEGVPPLHTRTRRSSWLSLYHQGTRRSPSDYCAGADGIVASGSPR